MLRDSKGGGSKNLDQLQTGDPFPARSRPNTHSSNERLHSMQNTNQKFSFFNKTRKARWNRPIGGRWRRILAQFFGVVLASALGVHSMGEPQVGMPFSRSYSLDEIGVSRGVRLEFDPIGRIAAINDKKVVVLNDTKWINLTAPDEVAKILQSVKSDSSNNIFYGALADWGRLKVRKDGKLVTESLRTPDAPAWVNNASFISIILDSSGVFFGGPNGVVHLNRATNEQSFIHVYSVEKVFKLGSKVYVSSHLSGLSYIDILNKRIVPVSGEQNRNIVIDHVSAISDNLAVISTVDDRLALFDGYKIIDWPNDLDTFYPSPVSNILSLPDGRIAISLDNQGLFILSEDGETQRVFSHNDYHSIGDIASREPGVLWISTESGIEKLLYNDPVGSVDQRSGLIVNWPEVIEWRGQPVVASNGSVFERVPGDLGISGRFRKLESIPIAGVSSIAAFNDLLLVANPDGVFSWDGATFETVRPGFSVHQLISIGDDVCFAISGTKVIALKFEDGKLLDAAPDHNSIGFPFITLATDRAAWIELGAKRIARLSLKNGTIQAEIIEDFPWPDSSWIHAGYANGLVVLQTQGAEPLFYDEKTEAFTDDPQLSELFRTAPMPITRLLENDDGTLWVGHEYGLYAIHRTPEGFEFDLHSFRSIRESYPILKLVKSNNLWAYSGTTLYRVDSDYTKQTPSKTEPTLVSLRDLKTDNSLYSIFNSDKKISTFPFAQNGLEFLFFSGSYLFSRPLSYQFTMSSQGNDWTTRSAEPSIALSNLAEGDYTITGQALEGTNPFGEAIVSQFHIQPPWHRSTIAYVSYWSSGLLASLGIISLITRRSKRKHQELEKLVHLRTEELRATMEKLTEEARNSATLAERNRLAGEIHDSLQQGLSGLALQLDATLKLNDLSPDIQSRLSVARRMVSFTRQEVQQAVWDLESPLLENNDLVEALQTMAGLVGVKPDQLEIVSNGKSVEMPSETKHHLLRVAQETITNAVRHSKADRIQVRLDYSESRIELTVSDNGSGFNPNEIFSNGIGHFGLRGIQTRATKIGGKLAIESSPGKGTQISLTVPL